MNAEEEDGKLKAEAWLEVERVKQVDNRILEALEKGEMVELSTGLFTDNEPTEGDWNGEKYMAIARNFRPDHLAILPDKVGACSIADGAGLLRLNQAASEGEGPHARAAKAFLNVLKEERIVKEKLIAALITNTDWTEEDREFLMGLSEEQLRKMQPKVIEKEPVENKDPQPDPKSDESKETETEAKPITVEDYVSNAPAEIRDMLVEGLRVHQDQKTVAIKTILENKDNVFTENQLKTKTLGELQAIAALAKKPEPQASRVPLYMGMGETESKPVDNVEEEPMVMPSIFFSKLVV
jgi:hypothetical protein